MNAAGYVYLMKDSQSRHKIGFSREPDQRLISVRAEIGDGSVTLVHIIRTDDMVQLERILHKMHEACRDEGEWFHLDESSVESLCQRAEWTFGESDDYEIAPGKKPITLRLHKLLRQQLELLVDQNASTLTSEISIALRERLERANLWPPEDTKGN